jgi:hypothetical protein
MTTKHKRVTTRGKKKKNLTRYLNEEEITEQSKTMIEGMNESKSI